QRLPVLLLFPSTTLFRSGATHSETTACRLVGAEAHQLHLARRRDHAALRITACRHSTGLRRTSPRVITARLRPIGRWRYSGCRRDRKSTRLNSSHVKISY